MTFFGSGGAGLLKRFRDGDSSALEDVYRSHVDAVARAVASALRRYGGANGSGWKTGASELPDLVQEVFTRAFEPRTRRGFDGLRDYEPYLSQIARNVVVDHLRRKQRQVPVDLTLINDFSLRMVSNDPDEDFGDFQTMALVGRYIAELPTDLRRVHEALYVQGLSQREAAQALGLGRQVIRTLEARLRGGLRNLLEMGHREVQTPSALVDSPAQRRGRAT